MYRVLIVCTGNTCRSPMAEALFRRKALLAGQAEDIAFLSAGISAGLSSPASRGAQNAMSAKGLTIEEHRSRQVTQELIAKADLVLTMTYGHKAVLTQRMPGQAGKIWTLAEFAGEAGDVADPYGGNDDIYREAAIQIEILVDKAWKKIAEAAGKKL